MRHCVALMASVRTDWVPSDASVTRATRSPRMAKAVWVSIGALVCVYKMEVLYIIGGGGDWHCNKGSV